MLMKGKAGTAMPSFLLDELNGSEGEESDEGEIKDEIKQDSIPELPPTFVPDPLLERPPSPFLSEVCKTSVQYLVIDMYYAEFQKVTRIMKKFQELARNTRNVS